KKLQKTRIKKNIQNTRTHPHEMAGLAFFVTRFFYTYVFSIDIFLCVMLFFFFFIYIFFFFLFINKKKKKIIYIKKSANKPIKNKKRTKRIYIDKIVVYINHIKKQKITNKYIKHTV